MADIDTQQKKVVLITGCSSGIGFETVRYFAKNGWHVYAGVRDSESEGVHVLKELGLSIQIVSLDVTGQEQIKTVVETIISETGQIDVLVNNAGVGYIGPVEMFSIEEVKAQYDVNLFGYLRMIKAVAPHMRQRGSGHIINIGSINGLVSLPLYGLYSSTKFALETLTTALRFELAPFNIKVAIVDPGVFKTKFPHNRVIPRLAQDENSPYKTLIQEFMQKFDFSKRDLAGNSFRDRILKKMTDPRRVARKIYQLATHPNPKLRNVIGIDARMLLFLNKIVPRGIWNKVLRTIYKW